MVKKYSRDNLNIRLRQTLKDGKPIIILGETVTGGYRKIATVISADLFMLGQIKPGDQVEFISVTKDEADLALRETEDRIAAIRSAA